MKKLLFVCCLLFTMGLTAQDLLINEFSAKNHHISADPDFRQFADWIEIYNPNTQNLNLNNYYLTDDPEDITKWQFPTGTGLQGQHYLVIWADGADSKDEALHTNFKLSTSDGWIGIYDQSFNLVHEVNYTDQYADISYGLSNGIWVYYGEPTPGQVNSAGLPSSEREPIPEFSLSDGFYITKTLLELSSPSGEGTIHYSLDGSFPTLQSTIYNNPIELNENTVIRARIFGSKLPGPEKTGVYFVDVNKDLPVVSMIIDPDFLWNFNIGIFVDSLIGLRKDWERFSNIKYFVNKELAIDADNDIRLFGNTAFTLPQKSVAIFPEDKIEYPVFNNNAVEEFKSLILRSSSDDWASTMFRDGFVQTLIGQKLPIDHQAYQPAVLYINGEYYGIFNIREKYNEDYLKYHHGINKDEIDMLELNYWTYNTTVLAGSDDTYNELLSFLGSGNISDDSVFNQVYDYLDIDNYTHYIITEIYVGNISYKHNIKTWRENTFNDGLKWLFFDADRGYLYSSNEVFQDIYDNDPIFKGILENENYRNHFLQQTCAHINTTFRKSAVDLLIDSLKANIETEMPFHIQRWAPSGGVQSLNSWNDNVQGMKNFAGQRKDTLLQRLNEFYSLDGLVNIHLTKSHPHGGIVYMEGVKNPYNDSIHTFFKNIPVNLVVKPNPGYTFVDWQGISENDSITMLFDEDMDLNVRFQPDCDVPAVITEDFGLTLDCSPYYFQNSLVINEGATLYCEPGVEINFADEKGLLVKGTASFIGTASNPIIIQGQNPGAWHYIDVVNGEIDFENVHILAGRKAIHFYNSAVINISNSVFYESDADLDDLISGTNAIVEIANCKFYGNPNNTKKDGIDCDSIQSGTFTNNEFFDITDDCIDIGTHSSNVIITGNRMFDCQSMGISIGEYSQATISRNIVAGSDGGIQVHTGASAIIINNTLYSNGVGVQAYHYDNTPNSGGEAIISNTLFSMCGEDIGLQTNSVVSINYCLSDQGTLDGEHNLFDDPLMVQPELNNFNLLQTSPCIDKGDPQSPNDPDNTVSDIGALPFNKDSSIIEYQNEIQVYPNPFHDKFTISLKNETLIESVRVYGLQGNLIHEQNNINLNKCAITVAYAGLLIVRVVDSNQHVYNIKLIATEK
ncbi:MAG TPA: CotH kinase family protein [Bacteroidales bacterium]|nr:CotH kinase family protein [Bacteroidales bacterium]HRX97149.1 CotH kinase family protein [Bacteroidales bacterium]